MLAVQMKMARAALGLGVKEVAGLAGVSHDTITRLEAGEGLKDSTLDRIRAALEAAGVEFIAENGGGAGVRLRKAPAHHADAALDRQIAEKETAIAEMPEHSEPSPEAAMAAMDKALAENELVDLKNKRTRKDRASK